MPDEVVLSADDPMAKDLLEEYARRKREEGDGPPPCVLRCELATDTAAPSYVCTGGCGERVTFGVSQVLGPEDVPRRACTMFRRTLLRAFGPRGSRRLQDVEDERQTYPVPIPEHRYATNAEGVRWRLPQPPREHPEHGVGFSPIDGLGRAPRSRAPGRGGTF